VMTEVELLSTSETSALSYGLSLPSSFTLKPTIASLPLGFAGFSPNLFGLTIGNASLVAALSRGTTQLLVRGELRGVDGQPASFHVGDRYPVMTAGYFGDTSGGGKVYTPPPTVSFQDLGVVLKVTPHLHGSREVTLEVEAEFKALGATSLNGIPVITNRKFTASVRMKYEETAVMAGLVTESISQSWSGIPILVKIPGMGTREKNEDRAALLLTLKPRLVRLPPSETVTTSVWVGTEGRPLSPLSPVE
jgi:general secretion pathway protein D